MIRYLIYNYVLDICINTIFTKLHTNFDKPLNTIQIGIYYARMIVKHSNKMYCFTDVIINDVVDDAYLCTFSFNNSHHINRIIPKIIIVDLIK